MPAGRVTASVAVSGLLCIKLCRTLGLWITTLHNVLPCVTPL